jgi:hypothetical protein
LGHQLLARCYRVGHGHNGNWTEAVTHCHLDGGVLASADTPFYKDLTALLLESLFLKHGLGLLQI